MTKAIDAIWLRIHRPMRELTIVQEVGLVWASVGHEFPFIDMDPDCTLEAQTNMHATQNLYEHPSGNASTGFRASRMKKDACF